MNRNCKQFLIAIVLTLSSFISFGQNFEGWITYKVEVHNPNPEKIPDSTWQKGIKEQFGEKGYMLQKYFYKGPNYISEIEAGNQNGFQVFNPKDGLLYSWQKGSDTAFTVNSRESKDDLIEIIESDETNIVLNIACKSIVVKSKMGQMTLWYNSEYLKMDAKLYQGHVYGHWEGILHKIRCLPLKIEQKGFMSSITQTAIAYKHEEVNLTKFTIPKFKTITGNAKN